MDTMGPMDIGTGWRPTMDSMGPLRQARPTIDTMGPLGQASSIGPLWVHLHWDWLGPLWTLPIGHWDRLEAHYGQYGTIETG